VRPAHRFGWMGTAPVVRDMLPSTLWHWSCLKCERKATTERTSEMFLRKVGPGQPVGWVDHPKQIGLLCVDCAPDMATKK